MAGWKVKSNAEAGEGYSDITVEVEEKDIGILIELKYAEHADFDAGCTAALRQISDRNYEEALLDDGMQTIYKYGIACYKNAVRWFRGSVDKVMEDNGMKRRFNITGSCNQRKHYMVNLDERLKG